MDLDLSGRIALVSGSTAGIGFAAAKGLALAGASVIVNGRTQQRVNAACAAIRAGQPGARVSGAAFDLATSDGAAALVVAHPTVDVLINNFGIAEPKPFADIPDADWFRFFESAAHARAKLGSHLVRLERIGPKHSGRDDSLRNDQDGATRGRPRHRRNGSRHEHHGQ
jgi:NAD(P)-dependent dehydrogenase (short-subunit alcohol dehydrogenase family)